MSLQRNRTRTVLRRCLTSTLVGGLLLIPSTCSSPTAQARPTAAPKTKAAAFVGFQHAVMGTQLELLLPATPNAADAADSAQVVFRVFDDIDARMSEWKTASPLSAVNRQAGSAVPVPADLRALIKRGLALGKQTNGAFDITWAALWGIWDFKATAPKRPAKETLKAAAALIDYRQVDVNDRQGTVKLNKPGMKLGLGGIAKGYALERAAAVLRKRGINNFLLSAGGQVLAGGSNGNRPWKVGIRDPRGDRDDFFALLNVRDASVSTSGDYERFFIADGVRYHHILDPRTGMPTRGVRSATVVAADPTVADALSTAVMVKGVRAGMALLQDTPHVEGLLVDERGELHMTAGIQKELRLKHLPIGRDASRGKQEKN